MRPLHAFDSTGPPLGRGLLLIGCVALVRACTAAAPAPSPWEVGQPIALEIEALQGEQFRLLPGVGDVLAQRLEAARVAAGGRLSDESARAVRGVGPALLRRWADLRRP